MDLNQFTDFTEEEIKQLCSGFKVDRNSGVRFQYSRMESGGGLQKITKSNQERLKQIFSRYNRRRLSVASSYENFYTISSSTSNSQTPTTDSEYPYTEPENWQIDWTCVEKFPVYQVGSCGACSFFSAIDALQITLKIWGERNFQSFSMQAPLSCFKQNSKNVCLDGTNFIFIYDYVRKYGIGPAQVYPYTDSASSIDASDCIYQKLRSSSYRKNLLSIKEIYLVQQNDCREVVEQLRSRALTVAIIANANFAKYSSGTFSYDSKIKEIINHSVVLVGYHPDKGYLIKNVWGTGWGMGGYAYMPWNSGVCEWAVYAKGFYRMGQ